MNLNFFKFGLMALFVFGGALAAGDDETDDSKTLIIGCRPWDQNIQDCDFHSAHYVDFFLWKKPEGQDFPTFHHLDLNDKGDPEKGGDLDLNDGGISKAGKFSEFAARNPGRFETVIFDYGTYQHVRRNAAWKEIEALLCPGGKLIVPFTCMNMYTKESLSEEKARGFITDSLTELFPKIDVLAYEDIRSQGAYRLLCLPRLNEGGHSMTEDARGYKPAIIVATKKGP